MDQKKRSNHKLPLLKYLCEFGRRQPRFIIDWNHIYKIPTRPSNACSSQYAITITIATIVMKQLWNSRLCLDHHFVYNTCDFHPVRIERTTRVVHASSWYTFKTKTHIFFSKRSCRIEDTPLLVALVNFRNCIHRKFSWLDLMRELIRRNCQTAIWPSVIQKTPQKNRKHIMTLVVFYMVCL